MAEVATLTTLDYGLPEDYFRALVVQGTQVTNFTRIEQAHPTLALIIISKTPNDAVYSTDHMNAESILDGGFRGWLCCPLPVAVIQLAEYQSFLYETLGLKNEELYYFLEAYNAWVRTTQSKAAQKTPEG